MQTSKQRGSHEIIILIVVILLLIGALIYVYMAKFNQQNNTQLQKTDTTGKVSKIKNVAPNSTIADLAKTYKLTDTQQKIIDALKPKCDNDGQESIAKIANDDSKFVVRGYWARVNAKCGSGSFQAYLEKDDNNNWSLVEATQQAPNCSYYQDTPGISTDIITNCYDENTGQERPLIQ